MNIKSIGIDLIRALLGEFKLNIRQKSLNVKPKLYPEWKTMAPERRPWKFFFSWKKIHHKNTSELNIFSRKFLNHKNRWMETPAWISAVIPICVSDSGQQRHLWRYSSIESSRTVMKNFLCLGLWVFENDFSMKQKIFIVLPRYVWVSMISSNIWMNFVMKSSS